MTFLGLYNFLILGQKKKDEKTFFVSGDYHPFCGMQI